MSEYRNLFHYVALPSLWNLLSFEDQNEYNHLKFMFLNSDRKKQSKTTIHSFQDIFNTTRSYILKGDGKDWTRALVCGIIWLTCCMIVVNTKRIQILTGRSKSSINSSLQQLGYTKTNSDRQTMQTFLNQFPPLRNDPNELKQWTFRTLTAESQLNWKHNSYKSKVVTSFSSPNHPTNCDENEYSPSSITKSQDVISQTKSVLSQTNQMISFDLSWDPGDNEKDIFNDEILSLF